MMLLDSVRPLPTHRLVKHACCSAPSSARMTGSWDLLKRESP